MPKDGALPCFKQGLEQHPKIMRNVQRSRNRRAALPALTGVSPPASSALPCAPCPRFLFSHFFWKLLLLQKGYSGAAWLSFSAPRFLPAAKGGPARRIKRAAGQPPDKKGLAKRAVPQYNDKWLCADFNSDRQTE